ncbi:MAG: hypothetical protein ACI9YH_000157 [Colwellia sp.]|jgi:hypothetical protein
MKMLNKIKKTTKAVAIVLGLVVGTAATYAVAEETIIITQKAQETINNETSELKEKSIKFNDATAVTQKIQALAIDYQTNKERMTVAEKQSAMEEIFNLQGEEISLKTKALQAYAKQLNVTIYAYQHALNTSKEDNSKRTLSSGEGKTWLINSIKSVQSTLAALENINTPQSRKAAKQLHKTLGGLVKQQQLQASGQSSGITASQVEEVIEVLIDAKSSVEQTASILMTQATQLLQLQQTKSTAAITSGVAQISLDVDSLTNSYLSNVAPLVSEYMASLGFGSNQADSYIDSSSNPYDVSGLLEQAQGNAN